MKSQPRSIRLSEDALKALTILKGQSTETSLGPIISRTIVNAAKGFVNQPIIQFKLLDPSEYFRLQAQIGQLESLHRQNKQALMRICPKTTPQADSIAEKIILIDQELKVLYELRQKLASLATTTEALTPQDAQNLRKLRSAIKQGLEKTPNQHKPILELQLRIIESLL